jgi:zinc protease
VARHAASGPLAANAAAPAGGGTVGSAQIAPRVSRRSVAGIDVLSLKTSLKDVVTIRGSFPAGDVFNPAGHPALADLTRAMLDQGTTKHDKFALSGLLEDVGAEMGFGSGAQNVSFNAKCLKKDTALILELLAEQLRTPAFSAEEFAKVKKQIAGQIQRRLEDTNVRASQALARALYPVGHPNRPADSDAYLADLAAATLADVQAFHAAHYGPAKMILVAVGDIDDAALDAAIKSAFGGWTGGRALPPAPKAPALAAARTEKIQMPGKTSVSLTIGAPTGLKFSDPDRIALAAANEVFGGGYFSSRLLAIVRAEEGLTYGIGARLGGDTYVDGDWRISGTFAPDLLDKGVASTVRELKRFTAEGVSAEELTTFKTTITGSYKIALATSAGVASQVLATVQRGLPLAEIDAYPAKVEALTLAQVNAAVKKYLSADKLVTVMAGTLPAEK